MAVFLRCKDCKHDKGKCVGVSRRASHKNCFEPKVMTNADRIRDMSDEALCERLYHVWRNEADKGNDIAINWCDPECCSSEECDPDKHKACILRWLQRPAEEDAK